MQTKCRLYLLITLMLFCGDIAAQMTAVNAKGSKVVIDTSKWQLSGSNITAKNTGNVGMGVAAPLYKLDIATATNPLRLKGLQSPAADSGGQRGSLVVDTGGVVKLQTAATISAVEVSGSVTMAADNTAYFTDATSAPSESIDNLNEFSGHTFTAKSTGLYLVQYIMGFNQRSDQYMGWLTISSSNGVGYHNRTVVVVPPESGVTALSQACPISEVLKLAAGGTVTFTAKTYGLNTVSAGSGRGDYNIVITRID